MLFGDGAIRLFKVAGIQVSLHWSWLLVAWYQISQRRYAYDSLVWPIAEYLGLFLIVLLHEFGHSFASRQVGGESRDILLWPFGGIAFVKVPPRPGAELWSIAAGPLVNVVLYPVLMGVVLLSRSAGWTAGNPELDRFLMRLFYINQGLLIFNLLPIYPLDGGQILRSLLWFKIGRVRSIEVATVLGFVGIALLAGYGLWRFPRDWIWILVMSGFLASQCLASRRHAASLRELERMPRHPGFACPACQQTPQGGPYWLCAKCNNRFDPFSTAAVCPHCQTRQAATPCPNCGAAHPIEEWAGRPRA